jgi:hypothetical protein
MRMHDAAQRTVHQPVRNDDLLLHSISQQLALHSSKDLSNEDFVIRKGVDDVQERASIRALLDPSEPANLLLIKYEEWHQESLRALNGVSNVNLNVSSLTEDMLGLHRRILVFLLHKVEQNHIPKPKSMELVVNISVLPSLEGEIAFGITHFIYPESIIVDLHDANGIHDPYSLPERGNTSNGPILEHLRWINAIILSLKEGHDAQITPSRRQELIAGLNEHRANIFACVKSKTVESRGHKGLVITVIRSTFHLSPRSYAYNNLRNLSAIVDIQPSHSPRASIPLVK